MVAGGARGNAEDRSAPCRRGAARAGAGAASDVQLRGDVADRRPGGCGPVLGRQAQRPALSHGADHRPGDRARIAARRAITRSALAKSNAVSGWLGAFEAAGCRRIRSISTSARAATPASRSAPSRRSTGATRSISIAAAIIASASSPAARSARSTSTAARATRASERFDLVLDLGRDAVLPHAPAAAGLLAPGRRRRSAGGRRGRDRGGGRQLREAEVLQLQGIDLRALALAAAGLQPVSRRLLDRGHSHRTETAITCSSSRTCAWAAARARRCAPRAR